MEVGMPDIWRIVLALLFIVPLSLAQETHIHGTPEKLGKVSFPISCAPAVQEQFDRGVALLHSFAYAPAEAAFQGVAKLDPRCAMAHWGMAMTYFHQLWEPPLAPGTIPIAQKEIQQAQQIGTASERERQLINALALIFQNAATVPYRTRALNYEQAMSKLASENRKDIEAQVFYVLALLANASPADKTHTKQKQAADLLEPLNRTDPQHPGIPHYLIHAYDNAELAPRGLPAARAYSQIAPSAPHALHMPSHIFTRLGLWDDSIASNLAAKEAAHHQAEPVHLHLDEGLETGQEVAMGGTEHACRPPEARVIGRLAASVEDLDHFPIRIPADKAGLASIICQQLDCLDGHGAGSHVPTEDKCLAIIGARLLQGLAIGWAGHDHQDRRAKERGLLDGKAIVCDTLAAFLGGGC